MGNWRIINDNVMGGISNSTMSQNSSGELVFKGSVSLENNGGFSSVRYGFDAIKVNPQSIVSIRLKGDGKDYQFRIKDKSNAYYSYIITFKATGKWETINIKLSDSKICQ